MPRTKNIENLNIRNIIELHTEYRIVYKEDSAKVDGQGEIGESLTA